MDLGPEFRLFCLALRRPQSADDVQEMRRLAAAVEHWDFIVRGARRHRLAPVVLAGLQACHSPHLPEPVVAELRRLGAAAALRSLRQVAEAGRLYRLCAAAGIRVLVVKGVALSAQLYGEQGLRSARDIDLLVGPDQVHEAHEALVQAGYRPAANLASPRQRAAYLHWIKEVEFIHPVTGELVELHHRLADNPDLLAVDFASLWNEREEVVLGDQSVATLPRHRLPLYLCVHGASHGWARLLWLVDFVTALRQSDGVDAVIASADACGLRWPVLHALALGREWLGLPVEDARLAAFGNSPQGRRLAWLLRRLYSPRDWYAVPAAGSWKRALRDSLWERLYRFALKSDWRYRTNELKKDWFSPADREIVPLPEEMSWLYPLVRPWGWLLRRLSLP